MARNNFLANKKFKPKSKQKGIALVFFAFLLGLAVTGLGLKLLSGGNAQTQRNIISTHSLAEAKTAIIGNVISGLSGTGVGQFPCSEDTSLIGSLSEGQALGSCSNSVASVGRFAWRSMGTGALTDGNNDKLWYAISSGYRAPPINSDSIAGLSIDGIQNEAISIIFSPGAVLATQSRPTPTSSSAPLATAYLDSENADNDGDFITGVASTSFNDKLIAIKPDDIFPILEKRALGEFKNYLNAYKTIWGAFPFPAPFGDPTTATYIGNTSLDSGFIPISNANPTTSWNTSVTPTPIVNWPTGNSGSTPACTFRFNGTIANGRIRCEITISSYNSINPPTVSISGILDNIGSGFYDGLNVSNTLDVQITTRSGSATVLSASRAINHSLNSSGSGTVTFTGTLANTGVVRIEYRRTPPLSNWVLSATNHYLLAGTSGNNWHHLTYYKVATPFLPGGSASCASNCLTISTIDVTPNISATDKHALLISTGRKLNATNALPAPTYGTSNPAQTRPSSVLNGYLDSNNNISGGLIFDTISHPLLTFNDQVQIIE